MRHIFNNLSNWVGKAKSPSIPHKLLLAAVFGSALLPATAAANERIAVFAGGCFWCMEEAYEKVPGVTKVISGYSGGKTKNPTYQSVTGGNTGHYEAVQVYYDDTKLSFEELLEVFWTNIDPLDDGGQFCDRGSSYKSALFYLDAQQERQARASLREVKRQLDGKVVTPVLKFDRFYAAEDYHQDYYKKSPTRYKYYKYACGRPGRLKQLWGDKNADAYQQDYYKYTAARQDGLKRSDYDGVRVGGAAN